MYHNRWIIISERFQQHKTQKQSPPSLFRKTIPSLQSVMLTVVFIFMIYPVPNNQSALYTRPLWQGSHRDGEKVTSQDQGSLISALSVHVTRLSYQLTRMVSHSTIVWAKYYSLKPAMFFEFLENTLKKRKLLRLQQKQALMGSRLPLQRAERPPLGGQNGRGSPPASLTCPHYP